jgi:hypothetical protein
MKVKTSELTGLALDWAVAKCEGHGIGVLDDPWFAPSTNWAQAGLIIEREWICIEAWPNESDEGSRWVATRHEQPAVCEERGPTPLVAAMRCYVASQLGDEIEIPEELQ